MDESMEGEGDDLLEASHRNQWRVRSVPQALKERFKIEISRVLVKRKTDVEIAFNLLRNPRKHMSLPSSPTTGPSPIFLTEPY
jgi:hypothetical protein